MEEKTLTVGSGTLVERTYDNGKVVFQAKIRRSGFKQSKTFKTKKEALDYLSLTNSKIINGESISHEKIKKIKLSVIFSEYLEHHTLPYAKKNRIERLSLEIGDVALQDFKSKAFGVYLKTKLNQEIPDQKKKKKTHSLFNGNRVLNDKGELVKKKYKPSSIRKYYYDIKMCLHWHSKVNDYHFDEKPFLDNPPPPAWEQPRTRNLEDGELERLIAACDKMYVKQEELKCLILFLYYSSFRLGETLKIRFRDLRLDLENPERSYVFIPKENQKTAHKRGADDRYASIRKELFFLIKDRVWQWKKSDDDLVFPFWKNGSVFYARFKVVCKNANVKDFTAHSLRHSALRWFFESTTLTDIEISKISGHIELDTLKRYANLRPHKVGAKLWASS